MSSKIDDFYKIVVEAFEKMWESVSTVEEVDDFMDALHSNDESGEES